MGCASSTPIMNGEPGAGLVGTAKNAAGNVMKAGETALHDAGNTIGETVEHVKDTVVDAMQNVTEGIENAISGGKLSKQNSEAALMNKLEDDGLIMEDMEMNNNDTMMPDKMPLKDDLDRAMDDMMDTKMSDEAADKMADDLIEETKDMVSEIPEAGIEMATNMANNVSNSYDSNAKEATTSSKTPIQSMDSFNSGSPEPELQILAAEEESHADSPKPSNGMMELVDLEATPTMTETAVAPPEATESTTNGGTTEDIKNNNSTQDTNNTKTATKTPDTNNNNSSQATADTLHLDNVLDTVVMGGEDGGGEDDEAKRLEEENNNNSEITLILTEPTQWERFADGIIKSHLERKGKGIVNKDNPEEHTTEQNIEL